MLEFAVKIAVSVFVSVSGWVYLMPTKSYIELSILWWNQRVCLHAWHWPSNVVFTECFLTIVNINSKCFWNTGAVVFTIFRGSTKFTHRNQFRNVLAAGVCLNSTVVPFYTVYILCMQCMWIWVWMWMVAGYRLSLLQVTEHDVFRFWVPVIHNLVLYIEPIHSWCWRNFVLICTRIEHPDQTSNLDSSAYTILDWK